MNALDDLPDDELAETLLLLWWLRNVRAPWHVASGSKQHRLAANLCRCGLAILTYSDADMDAVMVELVRRRRVA